MKEKEEEEKVLIDNYFCVNSHDICYNNLIREERKCIKKDNNQTTENMKYQVAKNLKNKAAQFQNLRSNKNQATAEIRNKRIKISMSNKSMEILKEE